jgi:hypothetical protein
VRMKVDASRYQRIAALAVITAGIAVPALAPADEAADRKAEAQRLFAQGQTALDKGDNATACTLMRKSLALFAVANSLFNVAQCDERDGKLASALEHWKRGSSLIDVTDKRTPIVKKAIEELEARVPRVRIVVSSKHEPVDILFDDEKVPEDKLAMALFVDPGKHVVTARKQGHADRRVEIVLNERERTEVVAEPGEVVATPVSSASVMTSASVAPPLPPPPPPPRTSPMKVGGFVALGVGAASILGAAITGGVITSQHTQIGTECPQQLCSANGRSLIHSQETLLPLNAALWGIGLAGAAVGTVMLVVSSRSKKETPAPTVAPLVLNNGGGIGLSGRF